jgi:hypothetical protein
VDFRVQPERIAFPGLSVFTAALLLSATTHAATNAVVPCEQVGRDLQSLSVPVDELKVATADHVPINPDVIDAETAVNEPVAPILNLGPRVTNILRDVFDTTTNELLPETSEQATASPLADTDDQKDASEANDETVEETRLPLFQRRMLRTDI